MLKSTETIAEMNNSIILASFESEKDYSNKSYQSEQELEERFIQNLVDQGYERLSTKNMEGLYVNLRNKIEKLNELTFSDSEWNRFLIEYLDKESDSSVDKTAKFQEDYIYDFTFDNGTLKNIIIIDKKNINNNSFQVASQITTRGMNGGKGYDGTQRYDVTILINGLPLVHIELKRRGVSIREGYNQIEKYRLDSFASEHSLYKFVQLFVVSNGTYTKYFANTITKIKNHFKFTSDWADAKNNVINDIEDFTKTFFERRVLFEVLTKYCVFDSNKTLLVLRPYQIAATERILWKIKSAYKNNYEGSIKAGGFVWHTTGSGKTLTSFKAARLATQLDFIDKVIFVVDRKDLDNQTIKEYQRFDMDSVHSTSSTYALKKNIEKNDQKIVVTTIQKFNRFVQNNPNHPIYNKHCVLIYDECHRSQFGEAQRNIRRAFKKYYQFGFTGTPIFAENSINIQTTSEVFGSLLHTYVITDAIRDRKVLKFKVDYNNIKPQFKDAETEEDPKVLKQIESKLLLHPDRIKEVTKHILKVFNQKTRRSEIYNYKARRLNGFNAMFAVQSVEAAKLYYEEFKKQQKDLPENKKIRVATIYSFAPNEEQKIIGEIADEDFEIDAMNLTAKNHLSEVVSDYNCEYKTNFSINNGGFQDYYKDLSKKVKDREVDLVIVVGMFLTGFDAPTLNTLFVDKNLRYHGLIQAFSRTNRILNKVKEFGNIVCFRDLEKATEAAIKLFADTDAVNIVLEKSFDEYLNGFVDPKTNKKHEGYIEVVEKLLEKYPDPTKLVLEADKKEFAKLFGKLLRLENILKNFDEFYECMNSEDDSQEELQEDSEVCLNEGIPVIPDFQKQDMQGVYIDILENRTNRGGCITIDFEDIDFEVELLRTDEINLDFILDLIAHKANECTDNDSLQKEILKPMKSSLDTRYKTDLVVKFIELLDLNKENTKDSIASDFYEFAKKEKNEAIDELIESEELEEGAKRFIKKCIRKGSIENAGDQLDEIIGKVSRRGGKRAEKKHSVVQKINDLISIFVGV